MICDTAKRDQPRKWSLKILITVHSVWRSWHIWRIRYTFYKIDTGRNKLRSNPQTGVINHRESSPPSVEPFISSFLCFLRLSVEYLCIRCQMIIVTKKMETCWPFPPIPFHLRVVCSKVEACWSTCPDAEVQIRSHIVNRRTTINVNHDSHLSSSSGKGLSR